MSAVVTRTRCSLGEPLCETFCTRLREQVPTGELQKYLQPGDPSELC